METGKDDQKPIRRNIRKTEGPSTGRDSRGNLVKLRINSVCLSFVFKDSNSITYVTLLVIC